MPIEVDSKIRVFSEYEFHELAHRVMGVIFGVHNDFGRLMAERIYQPAILRRCKLAGIVPARREVEIRVRYQDFHKSYFIDLLFACGLIVELKVVDALNNDHYAQTLHYLFLTGLQHGLLANLRSGEVKKQYVSTTLDLAERRRFVVHDANWESVDDSSQRLRFIFLELLADWGAFLQMSLYREAVMHFFGGPSVALRPVTIYDANSPQGTHKVCLIAEDIAVALTALKEGRAQMKDHLQRFLRHTRLTCIQWINMDNHDIEFQTLKQ